MWNDDEVGTVLRKIIIIVRDKKKHSYTSDNDTTKNNNNVQKKRLNIALTGTNDQEKRTIRVFDGDNGNKKNNKIQQQ